MIEHDLSDAKNTVDKLSDLLRQAKKNYGFKYSVELGKINKGVLLDYDNWVQNGGLEKCYTIMFVFDSYETRPMIDNNILPQCFMLQMFYADKNAFISTDFDYYIEHPQEALNAFLRLIKSKG